MLHNMWEAKTCCRQLGTNLTWGQRKIPARRAHGWHTNARGSRKPPSHSTLFLSRSSWAQNFLGVRTPQMLQSLPGHQALVLTSFTVIVPLSYKKILPNVPVWCHLLMMNLTQLPRCCWCRSTSKWFFMSERGFRPQCSTASWTGMCCHSPEYQSVGGCAGLGWAFLPEASPRAQLVSQWQIQASLTFGKTVFLCLLFLTISSVKSINKACYSKSNRSRHKQQFLFPSCFPHLDAMGAAQWEAIRGKNSSHLL